MVDRLVKAAIIWDIIFETHGPPRAPNAPTSSARAKHSMCGSWAFVPITELEHASSPAIQNENAMPT